MRVDRIGVMYRRQRGNPAEDDHEEERLVDLYMERRMSRENPFTAADTEEIRRRIEYILEISGDLGQGASEEATASLLHLCEVWMRIALERCKQGTELLTVREAAVMNMPKRELTQAQQAALTWLTSSWMGATESQ